MDGPVVLRPGHPETPAGPVAAFGSFRGDMVKQLIKTGYVSWANTYSFYLPEHINWLSIRPLEIEKRS